MTVSKHNLNESSTLSPHRCTVISTNPIIPWLSPFCLSPARIPQGILVISSSQVSRFFFCGPLSPVSSIYSRAKAPRRDGLYAQKLRDMH